MNERIAIVVGIIQHSDHKLAKVNVSSFLSLQPALSLFWGGSLRKYENRYFLTFFFKKLPRHFDFLHISLIALGFYHSNEG